jgi:copper homeostasis protein
VPLTRILEVIVTSFDEAIEAELGGADRLELVRSIEYGGFTPSTELVRKVVETVSVPVRVMLRENASMSISGRAEIETLQSHAGTLTDLPINGFVIGFVKDGTMDVGAINQILAAVPNCRATFHRAFDHLPDPVRALQQLKQLPQIDRVLTDGGEGSWVERKVRLVEWQRAAAPQIKLVFAAGLCASSLTEASQELRGIEVHVGRAARIPQTISGTVCRRQVASLKRLLG